MTTWAYNNGNYARIIGTITCWVCLNSDDTAYWELYDEGIYLVETGSAGSIQAAKRAATRAAKEHTA